MHLIHRLKTTAHEIPIDVSEALAPTAFATYTNEYGNGDIEHIAIGWELKSASEEKYNGHSFELRFSPDTIDEAIKVLSKLRTRFKTNAIPK